jgi:Tfp pilus assembly protein PilF
MEPPLPLLEQLRAACAENPSDPQAAARLAEHYADLGWYNEAMELYRDALALTGDDYFLLLSYGCSCFRRRSLPEALAAFLKLTTLRPERTEGWNNAGLVFLTMGKPAEASVLFDTVLALEPHNTGALLNLGNCLAQL